MSEVAQRTIGDAEAIAKKMGLICIFPRDSELVIDDDGHYHDSTFGRAKECLANNGINIVSELATTSKSGNIHRWLKLDLDITPSLRIAIQACLGSDPVKEILSAIRLLIGSDESACIAMFETETGAALVRQWRRGL